MNNNLEYLRSEIKKDPKDIDWDNFINISNSVKESICPSSFMGFRKGYINVVNISWIGHGDKLIKHMMQYNDFLILSARSLPEFNRKLRVNKIDLHTIKEKYVIIFSGKSTVDNKLYQMRLPIIKYRYTTRYKKYHGIVRIDDGTKIKFDPNDLVSMNRDYLMNLIFE